QGGSGVAQSAAGAEEEAGSDRAADGDHVDVARLEVLAVTGVARVRGHLALRGAHIGRCRVHGVLAHGWFHSLVRSGGSRPAVRIARPAPDLGTDQGGTFPDVW